MTTEPRILSGLTAAALTTAFCASALANTEDPSPTAGTWTAQKDGDQLYLQLNPSPRWNFGFRIKPSSLEKTARGFIFRRSAGNFELSGAYVDGRGGGTFVFRPSAAYRKGLEKRGLGPVTMTKQVELAALDVTLEFIDDLKALGYDESLKRYIEMRIHGATAEYATALAAAGHKDLSARRLIEMQIHGVTPEYIKALVDLKLTVGARRLVEMRIHGVTPKFVAAVRALRIDPSVDELVQLKIHGADTEFLKRMNALLGRVTARNAIDMRIHGVTPSFIEGVQRAGYDTPTPRELVDLRIHGASTDWIAKQVDGAKRRPTIRQLIQRRIHGE